MKYNVLTWDCDKERFTPQKGLGMRYQGISRDGVIRVLAKLQTMGYQCDESLLNDLSDDFEESSCSDPSVIVEKA